MTHQATLFRGGQTLQLLPERCAFWQEAGLLLLADLHLGKAAHLRHHGMAIPEGHTADDLSRLSRVLRRTQAREVIICGDFFHASTGQSPAVLDLVEQWRGSHPEVIVSLITGNHDRGRALPPLRCGIELAGPTMWRDPFHLIHDPAEAIAGRLTISGHLHPLAALSGGRGCALRAPCFWWQAHRSCLVLPGFGSFTAGVTVQPDPADTLHVITGETVVAVPASVCRPAPPRLARPRTATTGYSKQIGGAPPPGAE
ncbi:MAG: ligase-associated DNA damage response endonuclease PdeM [Verrucomicrobiota bacterium]